MSLTFRHIQVTDNKKLAEVIRTVLREFKIDRPGTVYTDPSTDSLFEYFQTFGSSYWLAFDDDKLIGGCGIYPTEGLPKNHVELVKFYLLSGYRGLGIGKELMFKCFSDAEKLNYKHIYLESMPELNVAVGLYEKYGFKPISERLGTSGHFACNILMLKSLEE